MKAINLLSGVVIVTALAFSSCKKDDDTNLPYQAKIQSNTFSSQSFSQISSTDFEVTINDAAITQTAFNSGAVLVYIQPTSNTTSWTTVPLVSGTLQLNVVINVGSITLVANTAPSTLNVKIVVVPPGARKANPNVNLHNYEEVKAVFHLKDK
jgi:PBP1b-binding outer membrane lipoprotein LpoB